MSIYCQIVRSPQLPLAVVLLALVLTGCDNSPSPATTASPTPTPQNADAKVAESEDDFQNEGDSDFKNRTEVRRVVSEFVKGKLPNWTLKGISTEPYQANVFWASVDIERDTKSVVVELAARKFFSETGGSYWKAVSLRKTLKDQLHDLNDAETAE